MKVGELFYAEWMRESASTRNMLSSVPEAKFSWKPHEKSKPLGALALHVAALPGRWLYLFDNDTFDPTVVKQPSLEGKDDIIRLFDEGSAKLTGRLKDTDEAEYDKTFTFSIGGKPTFTMSKAMGFRTLLFDHMIHHRAQLSVYLRLLDFPVPGMYGPTADEQ
ncbi:MAG: DinB family protein [Candidatus Micrarchaeaceae archaeon]